MSDNQTPVSAALPAAIEMTLPDGRPWRLEQVPCDFCGASGGRLLLVGRDRLHGLPGEFGVVECEQCGLVRTSPRPTLDCLGAAYPQQYGPHQSAALRSRSPGGLLRWTLINYRGYPLGEPSPMMTQTIFRPLGNYVLSRPRSIKYLPFIGQGRLLDFGCGVGRFVVKMKAAGWQAEGMDLSEDAVRIGRQAGLTMHLGTLPAVGGTELEENSYDALTMWQALEHVPSPTATLKAAWKLIRPGGWLLVALPRFDSLPRTWFGPAWYPLDLPRHLTHFTLATLERHVRSAGFEIQRTWPVRRPANIRQSYAYLAKDTGKALHRFLARSRTTATMMSLWCLLRGGRTQQMICIARKP